MEKAIVVCADMVKEGKSNEEFKASTGQLRRFMKRYGLSMRPKSSVTQKDPDQLISFVLHVGHFVMKHPYDAADIITMDETSTWGDMVSNRMVDDTGKKM